MKNSKNAASERQGAKPRIIVCADDFGMNPAINAGVLGLAEMGRLNATSCLVDGPVFAAQAGALRGAGIQAGLHLNLTEALTDGRPVWPLPRLIGLAYARRLDGPALRSEIARQFDRFETIMQQAPHFVDGHQHVHQLPQVRQAVLAEMQQRYAACRHRPWIRHTRALSARGVPMRQRYKAAIIQVLGAGALARQAQRQGWHINPHFAGVYDFKGGAAAYQRLLGCWLSAMQAHDVLMCHPAGHIIESDSLGHQRKAEFDVLASPRVAALLHNFDLNPRRPPMAVPINRLSDMFAVAPQLSPDEMAAVAEAGYRSVIINRPDYEGGPDQPASADVIQAAEQAGLQVAYLPVISGAMTPQDVVQFKQLLSKLPGPVLAYCRSGTRSTHLYQAALQL